MSKLRFMWNGLKVGKGALQRAHYSHQKAWVTHAGKSIPTHVSIYARSCYHFSAEIQEAFIVENDSNIMDDYFEKDSIRVYDNHPLYAEVLAAFIAQETKAIARIEKRMISKPNKAYLCARDLDACKRNIETAQEVSK